MAKTSENKVTEDWTHAVLDKPTFHKSGKSEMISRRSDWEYLPPYYLRESYEHFFLDRH